MKTNELIKFIDDLDYINRYTGGVFDKAGTIITLRNGKVSIGYVKSIGHSVGVQKSKYKDNSEFWFSYDDCAKKLLNDIPKNKIRITRRLTDLTKEGKFIQILHKSGYYYLTATSLNHLKREEMLCMLSVIKPRMEAKLGCPVLDKDIILEHVGIYKNIEERNRRKKTLINLLGELNCLNTRS